MPENGSINGGPGRDVGGGTVGSSNDNQGGERERTEQKDKFDSSLENQRSARGSQADDRDGLPPNDTTPDYTGPNPDPRGPALGNRSDRHEEDRPSITKSGPGDLPPSDTTPGDYTGPNPDSRGPALSDPNDTDEGSPERRIESHDWLEALRQTINDFLTKNRGVGVRPESPQDLVKEGSPVFDLTNPIIDPMEHMPLDDHYRNYGGGSGGGGGYPMYPNPKEPRRPNGQPIIEE